MNWKKWTAIGVAAATVITGVVLHLIQPECSWAWTELIALGTFVAGGVAGWLGAKATEKK